jgi:hypothetical protein
VSADEHLRLYQHVHLDHGYDHARSGRWPVTLNALELTHELEHRAGHFRWCVAHLLSEIPERTLAVAPPLEGDGILES